MTWVWHLGSLLAADSPLTELFGRFGCFSESRRYSRSCVGRQPGVRLRHGSPGASREWGGGKRTSEQTPCMVRASAIAYDWSDTRFVQQSWASKPWVDPAICVSIQSVGRHH